MAFLDPRQSTDTGPYGDSDSLRIAVVDLKARGFDRLNAGGNAVVDERVILARILGRHIGGHIKVFDGSADATRELAGIKAIQHRDTTAAVDNALPAVVDIVAYRRYQPKTRYCNSSIQSYALKKQKGP